MQQVKDIGKDLQHCRLAVAVHRVCQGKERNFEMFAAIDQPFKWSFRGAIRRCRAEIGWDGIQTRLIFGYASQVKSAVRIPFKKCHFAPSTKL